MRISDWSSDVCSSDLARPPAGIAARAGCAMTTTEPEPEEGRRAGDGIVVCDACPVLCRIRPGKTGACGRYGNVERSEEHTSELQSLMRISYAVFCLKKKNTKTSQKHKIIFS